jgi:hypothetical protein
MEEELEAGRNEIGQELAALVDQVGDLRRRQRRASVHEHRVQADAEVREAASALHGILERGRGDHETRRAQHTLQMGALDGFVDFR